MDDDDNRWDSKDPADDDLFTLNIANILAEVENDAVAGVPVFVSVPAGLTFRNPAVIDGAVLFYIAAGAAGQTYRVRMSFMTTTGRSLTRSKYLTVALK